MKNLVATDLIASQAKEFDYRSIKKPHPLVIATAKYCKRLPAVIRAYEQSLRESSRQWRVEWPPHETFGRYRYSRADGLDVDAALEPMDWVLWFHARLFSLLSRQGVEFKREKGERRPGTEVVHAYLCKERLQIRFYQGYSKTRMTAAELEQERKVRPYGGIYRYDPIDRMVLQAHGSEPAVGASWSGTKADMTNRVQAIAEDCIALFSEQTQARDKRIESERRFREEREAEDARRRRADAQVAQLTVALESSKLLSEFGQLEGFLAEVEKKIAGLDDRDRSVMSTWLDVVRAQQRISNPIDCLVAYLVKPSPYRDQPEWWPDGKCDPDI